MGIGDPELRVPKHRVRVELVLRGVAPRLVELFLAGQQERTWHRQEVLDLLEGEARFFPVVDGSETVLVQRDAVVWVRVDADGRESDDDFELFDQMRQVRIVLDGGGDLRGTIYYAAPPNRARLADELNGPGRFLRLWVEAGVYLIRKSSILTVVEAP